MPHINNAHIQLLATRNAENNKKFRTKKSGTFVFFTNTQAKTKKTKEPLTKK
jgi:hypothetical protein